MTDTTPGSASAASRSEPDPTPLGRYGDAFAADEPARCWRYVTHDEFRLSPNRCPHPSTGPASTTPGTAPGTGSGPAMGTWTADTPGSSAHRPDASPHPAERRSCRG